MTVSDEAVEAAAKADELHGWYEFTNRCICGERPADMERHTLRAALTAAAPVMLAEVRRVAMVACAERDAAIAECDHLKAEVERLQADE